MLCGADRGSYGKMVEELQNYFSKGNGEYAANMTGEYNLLINYKTSYKPPTILVYDSEDMSLANVGCREGKSNSYKGSAGSRERKVKCYFCGKLDHIAR